MPKMQKSQIFSLEPRSRHTFCFSKKSSPGPQGGSGAHPMGPRGPGVNFWSSGAHPMGPGGPREPRGNRMPHIAAKVPGAGHKSRSGHAKPMRKPCENSITPLATPPLPSSSISSPSSSSKTSCYYQHSICRPKTTKV